MNSTNKILWKKVGHWLVCRWSLIGFAWSLTGLNAPRIKITFYKLLRINFDKNYLNILKFLCFIKRRSNNNFDFICIIVFFMTYNGKLNILVTNWSDYPYLYSWIFFEYTGFARWKFIPFKKFPFYIKVVYKK